MGQAAIQSAETMAALRALATNDTTFNVPCTDAFASHFLGLKNKLLLRCAPHSVITSLLRAAAPGGYDFAVARTRHSDERLLAALRTGIDQLVILGAGYDSRVMRFQTELAGVRVFELDHPGTQARKKVLLAKAAKYEEAGATLISVDFAKQSFRDALASNGFQTSLKTLFLWEGVSYYLPQVAVADVLDFVSSCAAGSSIVFDYALSTFVAGDTSTYGGKQIARWLKKIGEPFLFGMSATDAPSFLKTHNLQVVSHVGPVELENLYLARRDGCRPSKVLGHLRIIEGRSTGMRQRA